MIACDTLPMSHRLFVVDVFAEEKYAGNQLAVVIHAGDLNPEEMQKIARETNFSETTFVLHDAAIDGGWDVRIFTPLEELPFAGHPTLGTAWIIRHYLAPGRPSPLYLRLGIGKIPVSFVDDEHGELVLLKTGAPEFGRTFSADTVAAVVGLEAADIATESPIEEVTLGVPFTFVPVASLEAMRRARFRSERWEAAQGNGFPGCFFLFCRETYSPDNQINARMFATPFGIGEDPATGSANACLGAYLLRHALLGQGPVAVRVEQGMEIRRPSLLRVKASEDSGAIVVEVGGRVVETIRGELL